MSYYELDKILNKNVENYNLTKIPQANDFEKIAKFPFFVSFGFDDANKIAKAYDFAPRQSNYYREATELFGLVYGEKGKYYLTEKGKEYVNKSAEERNKMLGDILLQIPIINKVVEEIFDKGEINKDDIEKIIEENSQIRKSTSPRRTSTIYSWMKWVQNNLGIVKVEKNKIYKI